MIAAIYARKRKRGSVMETPLYPSDVTRTAPSHPFGWCEACGWPFPEVLTWAQRRVEDGWANETTCERCGHVNLIGVNLHIPPDDEGGDADGPTW